MITILLQQIVDWLSGFRSSFALHVESILSKLDLIEENTDELPGITANTDEIESNTGMLIMPINSISNNTASIKNDVVPIKNNVVAISNSIGAVSTNTGTMAAYEEDIATNTQVINNRLVTIGSDTTQIRTNTGNTLTALGRLKTAVEAIDLSHFISYRPMSLTDAQKAQARENIGIIPSDAQYPVGAIYISVSDINPENIFGGTWQSFGAGRVIVGVDPDDEDFEYPEMAGGEKYHTLTADEMPTHNHNTLPSYGTTNLTANSNNHGKLMGAASSAGWATNSVNDDPNYAPIKSAGGNEAHNNLQPYITAYMWVRTA